MINNSKPQDTDLELQVCTVQEQVLKLLDEEEALKHLKRETAKDFRIQIEEIRARRLKAMDNLTELKQKSIESEGTIIIKDSVPQTTNGSSLRV